MKNEKLISGALVVIGILMSLFFALLGFSLKEPIILVCASGLLCLSMLHWAWMIEKGIIKVKIKKKELINLCIPHHGQSSF